MKRLQLKHCLAFVLGFILLFHMGVMYPKAGASVSIGLSSSNVSIGDSVTATVSVDGSDISAYTIYVSYDSSILEYNSSSGSATSNGGGGTVTMTGTGSSSISISFTAIANGSAYISTSGSECYDIDLNMIDISHAGVTVNVATSGSSGSTSGNKKTSSQTNDGKSDDCDLASLQISPGELTPAFDPATTSYYVKVEKDVTSMVVSASPANSKATTDVAGAGLIEPGDNTVTITVTAENGAVKVYTLNVVAGEDNGDAKATIDGKLYHFAKISEGLEIPEGFTETKFKFKEWEVTGFQSPNKKLTICLLENDKEEQSWFVYDSKKDAFYPYFELSAQFNRYVVLPVPEGVTVPEGFTQTEAHIGDNTVVAYISQYIDDKMIYLVYAMNISGEEGFYYYDMNEKAFLRYAIPVNVPKEPEIATPAEPPAPEVVIKEVPMKDTSFFNKKMLFWMLIGVSGLAVIFLLFMIMAVISKRRVKDELVQAEDMVAQLAKGRKGINREELIDLEDIHEVKKEKKPKEPKEPKKSKEPVEPEEDSEEIHEITAKKPSKSDSKDKPKEKKQPKSEIDRINQIELPDVDALVAEVTKDVPKEYDPDKDSAFSDDE